MGANGRRNYYRLKENKVVENKKKQKKTTSEFEPCTNEYEIIKSNLCLQQENEAHVPLDFSEITKCDSNVDTGTELETEELETDKDKEQNINTDENKDGNVKIKMDLVSAATILSMFKSDFKCNNKAQWNEKSPLDIKELFLTENSLRTLRDVELKLVVRHLKA